MPWISRGTMWLSSCLVCWQIQGYCSENCSAQVSPLDPSMSLWLLAAWLKEQVLKVIRDRIGELLVKHKWPLLEVTSGAHTEEIETDVLAGLGTHVEGYGLRIARLGNFHVGIDEDDASNLKRLYTDAAYLRTVGGVDQYQRFAAGRAMMGAGEGMARGGGGGGGGGGGDASGLLGGAGLGVGFGLAQMLVQDHRGGQPMTVATPGVVCASCLENVAPGKFCNHCGEELKAAVPGLAAAATTCTTCKAPLTPDAKFCGQCGSQRG